MTTDDAREVLVKHNEWRRGGDSTPMQDPVVLSQAIEVAIAALEKSEIPILCNGQSILASLNKYLDKTPREQVLADWESINQIKGGITVDEYLASLHAPVYHYLPEVPEDGETVAAYHVVNGKMVTEISFFDGGVWYDQSNLDYSGVFAWARINIPPKPPVKPTEEQP